MPSRNTVKQFSVPAYYHVYNRGAGGQKIFLDSADKRKFLTLLERHLSSADADDTAPYNQYEAELVSYCLMGNHFHLLFFLPSDPQAITGLMRSVSTAYSMYFNGRHKSQGHLFQSIYKASHINDEAYLMHITRYIHLNPRTYRSYYWSSLAYFVGAKQSDWIHPERVLDISPKRYLAFLEDYGDRKKLLEEIKDQLAM